jgi:hypothetical protein
MNMKVSLENFRKFWVSRIISELEDRSWRLSSLRRERLKKEWKWRQPQKPMGNKQVSPYMLNGTPKGKWEGGAEGTFKVIMAEKSLNFI